MRKYALLFASLLLASQAPAAVRRASPAEGGRMTLYLEAMDGQGWQLFFKADAVRRALPASTLRVLPLVTKGTDGKFASRRGPQELEEATRLAVLAADYPSRLLAYLNGRSLSPDSDGWRDAALYAGINPDELAKKAAAEGQADLAKAYAASSAAGAESSELLLDGKPYGGSSRLMGLYEAVNSSLPPARRVKPPKGYIPKPPPPPPGFWVVLSSGIRENPQLVGVFSRYFDGIKADVLDYNSPQRAKLFPALRYVPSYILQATPEAKKQLSREIQAGLFSETSGYLVFEDRQQRGVYADMPEKKDTLDVYVMSHCPYGVMAENSLLQAEKDKLLPEGLKWTIHYIGDASKGADGQWTFSSLHGDAEWREDARQLYIAEKYPGKFHDYLAERDKNINGDWKEAAKAAGIDAADVEASSEAAKALLAADFAASGDMGMTTSPSFLVNGREFMVGLGALMKTPGFEKVPAPGQPPAGGCNK